MSQIITYLTFNGNCREAMKFYRRCLEAELSIQTVGESPDSGKLPQSMKNLVLEAALQKGNMLIKGTDISDGTLVQGNRVTILLECKDDETMKGYYEKLAEEGEETYPIVQNFFGGQCGMLKDKFGFQWLLRSSSKL